MMMAMITIILMTIEDGMNVTKKKSIIVIIIIILYRGDGHTQKKNCSVEKKKTIKWISNILNKLTC